MTRKPISHNDTLWNHWYQNAESTPDQDAIVHWVAGEQPYRWSFSAIITAAEKLALALIEHDIGKGEVCAIIMRHNEFLYPLYLAMVCVGAIPAILAYPNPRLHPDKFRQGIEGMSLRSGLDWIFTERGLEEIIRPLVERPDGTIKGMLFPLEWEEKSNLDGEMAKVREVNGVIGSSDPLLLQHSSGTTGLQKPVLLSHCAVLEHVNYYGKAIGLNRDDKIISWLPLYHDMGLIAAFHLPLAFGIPSVQINPFEWVMVPALLLEAVSGEGGTISWLPNFAFNVMADKIADEELETINLANWRLIINCSEPIRHESHQKFVGRFQRYGLNPSAISTCYAMAETTFATTQTPPGSPPTLIDLDKEELTKGKVKMSRGDGKPVRKCVSSGRLIEGCQLKIVDDQRRVVKDRTVGEIVIKSASMFDGYRNYPEKTSEVLLDGWYYSGDYGFVVDNECYVIGRKKDLIIVAGNNIYPEDVEDAMAKVNGIIPGRVVAFGEPDREMGSERVSIVAETTLTDEPDQKRLRMDIIQAAMAIDVSVTKVYLVAPRWLIKSSAGKPSRKANKERILAGAIAIEQNSDDYGRAEKGHIVDSQVG